MLGGEAVGSRATVWDKLGGGDGGRDFREGERESRVGRFSSSMEVEGGG